MIIELTKENLQKCGFDNEDIERLIEWNNHASFLLINNTCYYANNIEKKIYAEIDGFKKYYFENGTISFPMSCPDLIPNYFDLFLKNYLDEQKTLLNTMFVEADQKKKFVLNEIEKIKSSIEVHKEDLKIKKYLIRDNKKKQIDILDSYLNFLKNKLNEQPQQKKETSKPDEATKEKHSKIFVENAFDIWEQMFESFKINKTKRTDLSFMYEVMLYDKLIHKTVSKKNIEDWINETYQFEIDKIHYTDIKTRANEKRMATYNLLKQSK